MISRKKRKTKCGTSWVLDFSKRKLPLDFHFHFHSYGSAFCFCYSLALISVPNFHTPPSSSPFTLNLLKIKSVYDSSEGWILYREEERINLCVICVWCLLYTPNLSASTIQKIRTFHRKLSCSEWGKGASKEFNLSWSMKSLVVL